MDRHPEKVTPEKLLLFLLSQDNRMSRRAGEEHRKVGVDTYEMYVNAIVDLHSQQVSTRVRKKA